MTENPLPDITDQQFIESCVNEHNNARTNANPSASNMRYMVVWATTYKVGCAVIFCPDGVRQTSFSHRPGALFVCNYATAGNYPRTRPYKEGPACSGCGGEKCYNKLCQNSTRDAAIYNNWQPDWDPALHECGVFCKAVLIIRPVALLSIFVSVYVIQCHCPNMFAYIN